MQVPNITSGSILELFLDIFYKFYAHLGMILLWQINLFYFIGLFNIFKGLNSWVNFPPAFPVLFTFKFLNFSKLILGLKSWL